MKSFAVIREESCYYIVYSKDRDECSRVVYAQAPKWDVIYHGHNNSSFNPDTCKLGCRGILGTKTPEDEAEEIINNIYEQRRNNREAERAGNSEY